MDKLVFVKELKSPKDKNGKDYLQVIDQSNQSFFFFKGEKFDLGKAYLFTFTLNDRGFPDVSETKPLVNIFQQRALKEVASRNDIFRNLSVCYSYAHDYVNNGTLEMAQVNDKTLEIYQFLNENTDNFMPKAEE